MQEFKIQVEGVFNELRGFPQTLAHIVAETATEVFKESFHTKSFDGKPWPAYQGKKAPTRGSLLLRSGNLMATIRPVTVTAERVTINAGSLKYPMLKYITRAAPLPALPAAKHL